MRTSFLVALACVLASGCESNPVAPTVLPAPSVSSVPTATPNAWDSDVELAAWVGNGVSSGQAIVVGTGKEAFIHVGLSQKASFHGPDLDPAFDVASAKMRIRYVDRGKNDLSLLTLFLRPIRLTSSSDIEKLIPAVNAIDIEHSGEWIETEFRPNQYRRADIKFALLTIESSDIYTHAEAEGYLDIDWITLVR